MSKKLVTSYTFTAASKTVDAADFTSLEKIQLITNVTDNIIIYNFADATKGGSLSGTTLTLVYDTTSMSDTDKLQIFVEDAAATVPVTDNGGSLTVDGTVAVTGVATAANQTTVIGHLDGVEGLLTTIDVDTGNISTKIDTVAGAVAGTEMQVDIVSSALPTGAATAAKQPAFGTAGTSSADVLTVQGRAGMTPLLTDGSATTQPISHAALTELAAAINSDKVDVNIVSGSSSGVQYTEGDTDATITGTALMMEGAANALVAAPGTAADGLLVNLGTNNDVTVTGTVAVTQSGTWDEVGINDSGNSITVDNNGTFATQVDGAALTALQLIDDPVATLGTTTYTETTTKGMIIGAVRRDADTTLVDTTNEVSPLQVDANGRLKVEAFSGETLPVSLASTTVTGTVAVTQSGTWDEVGINDSGNSITVDNGGTFAVQVDGSALTALQIIDDNMLADDGTGFTLGTTRAAVTAGVAVQTDGTDPTAVSAEGDVAALRTDMQRNLIVNQTHPRFWHVSADYASAQTNTSVKGAPGASLSLYITDLQISNGATAGNITLLDGSGGTVLYELYPAINGGAVLTLRSPIKLTANTALCITSTTVTTHSIFVSGYIAP